MEPILKVENLTKVFTRKGDLDLTAVNHVSFELYPGECLGIIGESGSGKSTLVNMVTRLLDATEGRIILDGRDITHWIWITTSIQPVQPSVPVISIDPMFVPL